MNPMAPGYLGEDPDIIQQRERAAAQAPEVPLARRWAPEIGFGYTESTCAECGKKWNHAAGTCATRDCRSTTVTETYHPPKFSEAEPAPLLPAPTAAQVAVLRNFKAASDRYLAELRDAAAQLRGSRIGLLDVAFETTGDTSLRSVSVTAHGVDSISRLLGEALASLEEIS